MVGRVFICRRLADFFLQKKGLFMNEQEKQTIYSVLVRLIESGETLTRLERRDLLNQLCMVNSRMTLDEILSVSENNRKLQIKRGTSQENDTYTGTSGEITMDTDTRTIRVHDGETAGGVALARISDIAIYQMTKTTIHGTVNTKADGLKWADT